MKNIQEFEAYWKAKGGDLELAPLEWGNGPHAYILADTADAWRLWLAAQKSMTSQNEMLRNLLAEAGNALAPNMDVASEHGLRRRIADVLMGHNVI